MKLTREDIGKTVFLPATVKTVYDSGCAHVIIKTSDGKHLNIVRNHCDLTEPSNSFENLNPVEPLDAWVENHKLTELQKNIECHIDQYLTDTDYSAGLLRCIFTSLRQELANRKNT